MWIDPEGPDCTAAINGTPVVHYRTAFLMPCPFQILDRQLRLGYSYFQMKHLKIPLKTNDRHSIVTSNMADVNFSICNGDDFTPHTFGHPDLLKRKALICTREGKWQSYREI